jgi:hypothetical protein
VAAGTEAVTLCRNTICVPDNGASKCVSINYENSPSRFLLVACTGLLQIFFNKYRNTYMYLIYVYITYIECRKSPLTLDV